MNELGRIDVRREDDVVRAHQTLRTVASSLGFAHFEQTRIATALSEIARNALQYAGGGSVTLCVDSDEGQLVIVVVDRGPGIADVEAVLAGERASSSGLGIGIPGSRRLVDSFAIDTSPSGTRVEMRKRLPRRAPAVTAKQISAIRAQLAGQLADEPSQEIGRLQRDIAIRDLRILELNQELVETNRGVMALHAELEGRAELQREALELRTRLLSEMGHEVRTPLYAVLTISQFLLDRLDGPLEPEQEHQVRIIHDTAETLTRYVNELLDLTRTDAGKMPVVPVATTVQSLLTTARRMMQPLARGGAVALRYPEPDVAGTIVTDENKVSQILRNLVANALKFTERGHVEVRARAGENNTVCFDVEDTGIGIPAAYHDVIFEEFARVEGPTGARIHGTGLGLPLSRRLAELLGGWLTMTSREGEGSVFTLTLPRTYEASDVAASTLPAPATISIVAQPVLQRLKILVIDDDEASRYVLRRWLEDRFVIVEASCGHDGIARAVAVRPDAIFLDVVMSDLSGFEVLDRLKADPSTSSIPVVVYTALTLGSNDRARLGRAAAILRKSTASRVADRSAVEAALVSAGIATSLEQAHD